MSEYDPGHGEEPDTMEGLEGVWTGGGHCQHLVAIGVHRESQQALAQDTSD